MHSVRALRRMDGRRMLACACDAMRFAFCATVCRAREIVNVYTYSWIGTIWKCLAYMSLAERQWNERVHTFDTNDRCELGDARYLIKKSFVIYGEWFSVV